MIQCTCQKDIPKLILADTDSSYNSQTKEPMWKQKKWFFLKTSFDGTQAKHE
jgi:hypothetical protein